MRYGILEGEKYDTVIWKLYPASAKVLLVHILQFATENRSEFAIFPQLSIWFSVLIIAKNLLNYP